MKRILAFSLFAFHVSLVATAAPSYWAAAYAQAATADKSGGAQLGNYSAYYCTVERAAVLFEGANTVKSVTSYFVNNYDAAKDDMAYESAQYGGGAGVAGVLGSSRKTYDHGQYVFNSTYGDTLATYGSAYLAILLYENDAVKEVRVMSSDADELADYGNAYFTDGDPTSSCGYGAWTSVVPEPTGALLLLLGVAGLGLRRRRA